MKLVIRISIAFMLFCVCIYGILFYQNNRETTPVSDEQIAQSYERGVTWLLNNREEVLVKTTPILWKMLGESAQISGDQRIKKLFDEYVERFDRGAPYSIWQVHFHPERFRSGLFSPGDYISLVEYQQYFLYAMTCSEQLAQVPLVAEQNNPNFCWHGSRIIRPACVTHQLMGYRMAQRSQCPIKNLDKNIAVLQKTIEQQLRYDPRVVDVYIQRVLMLVDSGAHDRVKPRWLQRVIDAQQADGGWSDMQTIIPIHGNEYFGFNATGVTVAAPISNLHATAQGILLMSLLRQK
jgi:hypothetical protein